MKLNCPFCGGDKIYPVSDASQGDKYGAITCADCGAKGPEVRVCEGWIKRAFESWGERHG